MRKRRSALEKATQKLQREMNDQVLRKYSATGIALFRYWGWKKVRIKGFLETSEEALDECAKTNETSILQILENETGIELRLSDNGASFHDYNFLDCINTPVDLREMSEARWLYMRASQTKWMGSMILASIFIALHRREGFGAERLTRLMAQVQEIEREYPKTMELVRKCGEEIDINIWQNWMKGKNEREWMEE